MQALDAVPEGDGTLLDQTVVAWVNELGLAPLNDHGRDDLPVVFAGGARAGLANGEYRRVRGTEWGHCLFTLAHLLGQTQLTSFGDHGDQLVQELLA